MDLSSVQPSSKRLVVLSCSATKLNVDGELPAINLYDGPAFRIVRSYLRTNRWPSPLSLAVLSAKYGLIGGLSHISTYDERMTKERADALSNEVQATFRRILPGHERVDVIMGKDYVRSLNANSRDHSGITINFADGPIGLKLHYLSNVLQSFHKTARPASINFPRLGRPLYFLPDWDDFLDLDFDFKTDRFSTTSRKGRREEHCSELMKPARICDGILVSLAQHVGTKGLLRRVDIADEKSLAPKSLRKHFGLAADQWAFGDCGAFSYSAEREPTISIRQAVALYDLYDFDLGASVDHIPLAEVGGPDGKRALSDYERARRVKLTRDNAEEFIRLHGAMHANFIPVGVVQGIHPSGYARQLCEYRDMGYGFIALGGLVPRSDSEVIGILGAVQRELKKLNWDPWIHLLGIFRPELQQQFRLSGIRSFDSATYFRKAWLRSDQNYLASNGQWYGAIRVPLTSDARTMVRLRNSGKSLPRIQDMERAALDSLRSFSLGKIDIEECLRTVLRYDRLLSTDADDRDHLKKIYRRTLEDRPWEDCNCNVCREIGINALIFRGLNRNKRRGAHNTLQLFSSLKRIEN